MTQENRPKLSLPREMMRDTSRPRIIIRVPPGKYEDDVRMVEDEAAMAPLPNFSCKRVRRFASISSSHAVLDSGQPSIWMS